MAVLVTGGAGYIGSHVVRQLSEQGYQVIVIDNLTTGFRENLIYNEPLIVADITDESALDTIFRQYVIDTVIHFAASIIVPDSVQDPLSYFANNTASTIQLLKSCVRYQIKNFIFSSTAAVYGVPANGIANEESLPRPINPYGQSKWMSEIIVQEAARAYGFNYAILRYFNVAGADPLARIGQRTQSTTHLIKLACQTALGLRPELYLYGTDYNTPDGTCIRDFIHIEDLANAHLKVMDCMRQHNQSYLLNVGYGSGYSVRDVIRMTQEVAGKNLHVKEVARREGDPPVVIAAAERIKQQIGWQPKYKDLKKIIEDSWRFEKKLHG